MIYIKDYNTLNSLVSLSSNHQSMLQSELSPLVGRTVTVFVKSGGASGNGFTGILIEISSEHIKLITEIPSTPRKNMPACGRNRQYSRLGTNAVILINEIVAITYAE